MAKDYTFAVERENAMRAALLATREEAAERAARRAELKAALKERKGQR